MADRDVVPAAGAVVWRLAPDGVQVLLVHRPKYDDWSMPKGKREPGEHMLPNAVREVSEETGAKVVLGRRLRGARYAYFDGVKKVDYWAGRVIAVDEAIVPNHEVDQVQWLSVPAAIELASYDHDQSVLRDFARKPPESVPLIVVRHASAGAKKDWRGEDLDRPLDSRGAEDALALAGLLSVFAPGPARVISSPALRCADTVRPYATLAAAGVEVSDALSDTGRAESLAPVIRQVLASDTPTVLCVHRENVPVVVSQACVALGAELPGDMTLAKAGFWVLNVAAGSLTGMDRYETT
jgi:8-oxo-dGTP pyrophosphatase MutT (NUDIX family)/phosphohistidine phosphatase SixA